MRRENDNLVKSSTDWTTEEALHYRGYYYNMRYLAIVLWPIVLIVLCASCLYVKIKWR
jgi:hypothetical protein